MITGVISLHGQQNNNTVKQDNMTTYNDLSILNRIAFKQFVINERIRMNGHARFTNVSLMRIVSSPALLLPASFLNTIQ